MVIKFPEALFYTILSELRIFPFYFAFTYQADYRINHSVMQEYNYKHKFFVKN